MLPRSPLLPHPQGEYLLLTCGVIMREIGFRFSFPEREIKPTLGRPERKRLRL